MQLTGCPSPVLGAQNYVTGALTMSTSQSSLEDNTCMCVWDVNQQCDEDGDGNGDGAGNDGENEDDDSTDCFQHADNCTTYTSCF